MSSALFDIALKEISEEFSDAYPAVSTFSDVSKIKSKSHLGFWKKFLTCHSQGTLSFGKETEVEHRIESVSAFDVFPEQKVSHFCLRNNLFGLLSIAMNLVREHFPNVRKIELSVEEDPEFEDQWLLIRVEVEDEIDQVLSQYESYTDAWIEVAPTENFGDIRLQFDIVR